MAAKKQPTKKTEEAQVTRISANDTAPKKAESAQNEAPKSPKKQGKRGKNPLRPVAEYFGGAWYELKQVRWPNRRATWGMTMAVLGFTAVFVVLILLLDALFKYLFQLILG